MRYLTFQQQFVDRILDGSKRHTIRKTCRLEPTRPVSLRIWTGAPYRSRQLEIGTAIVRVTMLVSIDAGFGICGPHGPLDEHAIARGDGFKSWPEMRDWFAQVYGLPFAGWIIAWEQFQPHCGLPANPALQAK